MVLETFCVCVCVDLSGICRAISDRPATLAALTKWIIWPLSLHLFPFSNVRWLIAERADLEHLPDVLTPPPRIAAFQVLAETIISALVVHSAAA